MQTKWLTRVIGIYLFVWYLIPVGAAFKFIDWNKSSEKEVDQSDQARMNKVLTTALAEGTDGGRLQISLPVVRNSLGFLADNSQQGQGHGTKTIVKTFAVYDVGPVLMLVLLLGALGSVVTCTKQYISPSSDEKCSLPYYIFTPLKGAILAGFFFVGMRTGALYAGGDDADITNPNTYLFVALSVGLFSEAAYEKLELVAKKALDTGK